MTLYKNHTKQRGFTLVELMLAIAFVGFVLLFVVTTLVQVMRTYNKGLAVKEINQTARTAVDEMTRSLAASAYNAVTVVNDPPVLQGGGRVCLGGVSYVWNKADETTNVFSGASPPRLTFVRVNDSAGALCIKSAGMYPPVNRTQATVLMSDRVWVQSIAVQRRLDPIIDITMRFSTVDDPASPAILPGPVPTCSGGSRGQFCAVATFNTTVVARGE